MRGGPALPLTARLFGPPAADAPGYLRARWLWLRALGLLFLSAFYALAFQIHGLVGERGILPAAEYLAAVTRAAPGLVRFWLAPTLLWLGAGDRALTIVVAAGVACALLLTANVAPRWAVVGCTACFLACVAVLQDFSGYQSDGMLLEAGFLSAFFAPRGARPGLGADDPPSPASLWLLRWEWFRIYFESGVVKLASGDVGWRTLTAMDHYYENGPLPAWLGWYAQQLPHAFHAATVVFTLLMELVVVWLVFFPRPFRVACFALATALQIGIILTANYAFLNYLVLALGVLLLDDELFGRLRLRGRRLATVAATVRPISRFRLVLSAVVLSWVAYASVAEFLFFGSLSLLSLPARALGPFRFANQYGLFAVMTPARYEIEFQGSRDGKTWIAYPFRYKPQSSMAAPRVFAPYQPRFDWNLWFASLDDWQRNQWVVLTQARLLENSPSVLRLFAANPFGPTPPAFVRTVRWQYWMTDRATRRRTGAWWRRELLGPYTGTLRKGIDGRYVLD